jgi:ATP-dependent Clp protease adaptor protein ClpS
VEAILFVIAAAGVGGIWWHRQRRSRALLPAPPPWGEDAEIAIHLAKHEARSRGQVASSIHLLYALLQDLGFAEAIARTGGDLGPIEDRVFEALEAGGAEAGEAESERAARRAAAALSWALHLAAAGGGRLATCGDLWAGLLAAAPKVAALVEAGGVGAANVLFTLVHGFPEREISGPERDPVEAVLVNDDITPQDHVVELLRDLFAMEEEEARRRMLEAHRTGRASLGRIAIADGRSKVEEGLRRSRSRGYPLFIRLEPAA